MRFVKDEIYHIYNRGNGENKIFFVERNYKFFQNKIKTHLISFGKILCYCLMPNHFHILMEVNENGAMGRNDSSEFPIQNLSFSLGKMLSSYTQAINKQNNSRGSLFQQKTKSKIVLTEDNFESEDYFLNAFHYIHQNPVKAGLVKKMEDWKYSSFKEYMDKTSSGLCNQDLFYELSGWSPDSFYQDSYGRIID